MLPPTVYADFPVYIRAVLLADGTCVFNEKFPKVDPVILHLADRTDPPALLRVALGR